MSTKPGNKSVKWHDGLPDDWVDIEVGADPPNTNPKSERPPVEVTVSETQTTIRERGSNDRWIVCTRGSINLDRVC